MVAFQPIRLTTITICCLDKMHLAQFGPIPGRMGLLKAPRIRLATSQRIYNKLRISRGRDYARLSDLKANALPIITMVLTDCHQFNRRSETLITSYWNNDDQKTASEDPLGNRTSYSYNDFNQVETITNPLGEVTTFVFDAIGNRIAIVNPLGFRTTFSYDAAGQVGCNTRCVGKPNDIDAR